MNHSDYIRAEFERRVRARNATKPDPFADTPDGVRGGEGRSSREVSHAGMAFAVVVLVAVAMLLAAAIFPLI